MPSDQPKSVPKIILRDLIRAFDGNGFWISKEDPFGFNAVFEAWNEETDHLFGDVPMFEAKPGVSVDEAGLLDEDKGIGYISALGSLQDGNKAPQRTRIYF
jgi:hypothetical protein